MNLSSSTYSALKTVGGYVKVGSVIVARIAAADATSSYVAIARYCPHEGKDQISYSSSKGEFVCSAHSWYFKASGAGDGNSSITTYTTSLSGTTLSVS